MRGADRKGEANGPGFGHMTHAAPARVEQRPSLKIRRAVGADREVLSALALRSKGHWGYPPEFLEACRAELTWSAAECASRRFWVAMTHDERILGFSLIGGTPPSGELCALFVDPCAIGTGCGRRLLQHALRDAAALGFERLVLDADPGAESFYARFGAVRIGLVPSGSVQERLLPRMAFNLAETSCGK